jgi:hypothetical protein
MTEKLNIELYAMKVDKVLKGETASLHMARDVVISLANIDYKGFIIGDMSEHPCILAKDLFPLMFKELSSLALVDLQDMADDGVGAIAQSKVNYFDVSVG